MPTRNVVLTEHHEEVIERLVKTARYQNASKVLRDGLRLVEKREAREKAKGVVQLLACTEANFREIARQCYNRLLITALRDSPPTPSGWAASPAPNSETGSAAVIYGTVATVRGQGTALSIALATYCPIGSHPT